MESSQCTSPSPTKRGDAQQRTDAPSVEMSADEHFLRSNTVNEERWRRGGAARARVSPSRSPSSSSPMCVRAGRRGGYSPTSLLSGWNRGTPTTANDHNTSSPTTATTTVRDGMEVCGGKRANLPWLFLDESVGTSAQTSQPAVRPLEDLITNEDSVNASLLLRTSSTITATATTTTTARTESATRLLRPARIPSTTRRGRRAEEGGGTAAEMMMMVMMMEDEDHSAHALPSIFSRGNMVEDDETPSVPDFISFPMIDDLHSDELHSRDASPILLYTPRRRQHRSPRRGGVDGIQQQQHTRDGADVRCNNNNNNNNPHVLQHPSESTYTIDAASLLRAPLRSIWMELPDGTHPRSKSCVSFPHVPAAASVCSTGADSTSDGGFIPIAIASANSINSDWRALLPRAARQNVRQGSCGSEDVLSFNVSSTR